MDNNEILVYKNMKFFTVNNQFSDFTDNNQLISKLYADTIKTNLEQ